jgi:hypothetical protein
MFIREEPAVTRATATNNKWRRRSRQEWETVFARFAASGLGIEPFCAREGLSESSFRRWRSILGEETPRAIRPGSGQTPEPIGFVDAGTLKLGGTGRLELRLDLGDGVILHLSRG